MKNRITTLFDSGKKDVLNVYFTAGYPSLDDTQPILKALEEAGADMVEIGMPYSDPIADGPVIQASSEQALANGMTIRKLLEQLKDIRKEITIPIMLMGYINPVLQYGVEAFVKEIASIGIDGLIFPDLPYAEYNRLYKDVFEAHNVSNIFLITPQTSEERLHKIDASSKGFVYIVSTNSTTGNESKANQDMSSYFDRIQSAGLENPTLIGFNIKDRITFDNACKYSRGAIIGTAFIKSLPKEKKDFKKSIEGFVQKIKG